jgi:hypothetical protein
MYCNQILSNKVKNNPGFPVSRTYLAFGHRSYYSHLIKRAFKFLGGVQISLGGAGKLSEGMFRTIKVFVNISI